jgi:PAS domain S-box-containing protein
VSARAAYLETYRRWGHTVEPSHDVLPLDILEATTSLLLVSEVGTGRVVTMNRATEELTGLDRSSVIGVPLWELVAPAHREMLKRVLEDPLGEAVPSSFESTVNLRSGKPRRIVWSGTFLTDDDGARTHIVSTGIDMSSQAASGGLFAHLMLAANATALISTDRRGRVTYCSSGAERLLGLDGAALVGAPLPLGIFDASELRSRASELEIPADLGVLSHESTDDLLAPRTGELLQEHDWTLVHADGHRLIASVTVTAARDATGRHVGYVGVAHDVTERRRANQVLEEALQQEGEAVERLHELDRAKTEFVATVSHELRTPTTSIVGCTEILLDGLAGELNVGQRALVDTVERNSVRLVALADDLVTLARVDAGGLGMELAEIDLRDVVSEAQQAVQTLLLDRSLETYLDLPSAPVLVCGDAVQLRRVVVNLLSNAVKFTDDGGSIACRLTSDPGEAVLEVSDSGIGIPRVEQDDLFTRFFRSSSSLARATQGSGLGLSIVSSIVQGHGGRIFVDSEHLEGTTFTVRIPLLPGVPLAPSPA